MKTDEQMAEEILRAARTAKAKNKTRKRAVAALCVVLAATLALTGVLALPKILNKPDAAEKNGAENTAPADGPQTPTAGKPQPGALQGFALSAPAVPEQPQYPGGDYDAPGYEARHDAWSAARTAMRSIPAADYNGLLPFLQATSRKFLAGDGENRVYSPANFYIALSMLASCTDGDTRAQLLSLLGSETVEAAQATAASLLGRNYVDDGSLTSVFANSLWLNESFDCKQELIDALAQSYYAYTYRGDPSDPAYTEAFQNWLKLMTGGLLDEAAEKLQFPPEMLLTLASTLYYKARWNDEFLPQNTAQQTFHAPSGDRTEDFMHEDAVGTYYVGENFAATERQFYNGGNMLLILPDAGVTPEALLGAADVWELIGSPQHYGAQAQKVIRLAVPKFDVSSDLELSGMLRELGVTDVFNAEKSDFTPLSDETGIAVSKVEHAARVKIDEQGCEAAAFTVEMLCGSAMPPQETVDLVLDRPFLFVIRGLDGNPLFIGTVNEP